VDGGDDGVDFALQLSRSTRPELRRSRENPWVMPLRWVCDEFRERFAL
jgi:hypothetical protein